ncbi:hypothetical protein Bca4012_035984 [Brassica carinata]
MAMCLSTKQLEHMTKANEHVSRPEQPSVQSNSKWNPNKTIIPTELQKSMILMKETVRTFVTNWNNHISD